MKQENINVGDVLIRNNKEVTITFAGIDPKSSSDGFKVLDTNTDHSYLRDHLNGRKIRGWKYAIDYDDGPAQWKW